jgi:uncharacterized RDD family membrane protein YckC
MRREIRVRTPENVEFGFRLAGLASRAAAGAIDYVIIAFLVGVLVFGLSFASLIAGLTLPGIGALASSGTIALMFVGMFLVIFGYFLFFELLWNGQTPGKRALGIRVVKDLGQGIGFTDSLVRNLVRIADILPGLYALGALSVLLSRRNKRLGDHAAGTLVVAVEKTASPKPFAERWERFNSLREDPALASRIRHDITPDEAELAREAWLRRETLAPQARAALMTRVAGLLRERLRIPRLTFLSDEQLVRDVLEVVLGDDRPRAAGQVGYTSRS